MRSEFIAAIEGAERIYKEVLVIAMGSELSNESKIEISTLITKYLKTLSKAKTRLIMDSLNKEREGKQ